MEKDKIKSFGWPEAIVLIVSVISLCVVYLRQHSDKQTDIKKHASVQACVTKFLDQEVPANIVTSWSVHGKKELQQNPYYAEEIGDFRVENANLMLDGSHDYKAVITENERGQRTMQITIYADHFRRYKGNPMDLYAQQRTLSITCTEQSDTPHVVCKEQSDGGVSCVLNGDRDPTRAYLI